MHKSDHYICKNCKKEVSYKAPGTKNRNHCPYCLYSVHVDNSIGDRKSKCWGLMVPTGKMFKNDAEVVTEKKVSLDLEIDHELKMEGMLRDVIRKLQNLRKKSSLNVQDKITATYPNDPEVKEVVELYENEIKEKVLAEKLEVGEDYSVKPL